MLIICPFIGAAQCAMPMVTRCAGCVYIAFHYMPSYSSRVRVPPGKIPEELYWKPQPGEPDVDDLTIINVGAGTVIAQIFVKPTLCTRGI
jgi:hypothetical protein